MDELEVAAYLDHRLQAIDRERADAHLAGCADCRKDVIATQQLLSRSRRPRRILVGLMSLGAAAALFLVVGPAIRAAGNEGGSDPLRDAGGVVTVVAYGPSGEASLKTLRFVWGAVSGATVYRLTVSGANGVPVWTRSTADTVLALSEDVTLQAGDRYYWITDVLLRDGTTRSTGLREFLPTR